MDCTARPAQIAGDPGDRADAHHRLVDAAQAHLVADGLHGVSQDVEADAHVGDGGGGKRGHVG
jgi:hypothetical protein